MTAHEVEVDGADVTVNLMYPRSNGGKVTIALFDVRAADDLTVQYDFDRDGWSITREVHREEGDRLVATGVWTEVAFVPAWTCSE